MLAACARSGLSVRAFATREGLSPKRLHWWRQRLGGSAGRVALPPKARRRQGAAESPSRFVPVVVTKRSAIAFAKAPIVIRRGGSTTMEFDASAEVSPSWVAAVMIELERAGCS